jgi:hypothetical protein
MTSAVNGQSDAFATTISNSPPLAVQAAMAQTQTWADHGETAALAHSLPDIVRLLNLCDVAEAMRAISEGTVPQFSGH